MALTTRDVLLDADAFRRAQPSWPRPEPLEEDARIDRDRDLLIKEGWPGGIAAQKALEHAREAARECEAARIREAGEPVRDAGQRQQDREAGL